MRTILHADLNNFYASVECLYNPKLRDVPVAVCGDVENRHGIVLAKNNLAKALGIKTGEAIWQAKQKCSNLVTLPPDYRKYLLFSRLMRQIYCEYTDQVESFGIDEAWLDVTGSTLLYGDGETIANQLRQRAKDELGVTLSIGVSFNKIFSKLGSDMKKPDATTVITQDNYKTLVWSLPVEELLYVGRATKNKLYSYGINTIGDLAQADTNFLINKLGKMGAILQIFALGEDDTPVRKVSESSLIKSVGNSTTSPKDLETDEDVKLVFTMLSESVAARLREYGLKCTGVAISLRDNKLYSFTRQAKLNRPTFLSNDIIKKAMALFKQNYDWRYPLRSIGVRGIDLVTANEHIQLSLFDIQESKIKELEELEMTIDDIRHRFGHQAIFRASTLIDTKLSNLNPKEDHIIHPVSYFK